MSNSDQIFLMENGSIIESGSYESLIQKNSAFSDFMRTYLESKNNNSVDYESAVSNQPSNLSNSKVKSTKSDDEQIVKKEKIESGLVKLIILIVYFF